MSRISRAVTVLAVGAVSTVPLVPAATATAVPRTSAARVIVYKNCTALNKAYPHGVGRPGAKDRTSGSAKARSVRTFEVDVRLYAAQPRTLDRDGIACEKR